ncbi:hypothetical protein WG66_013283 [Moniliophthora roreri]|nr:hypothetical protein WG66_013283 [Moniliophthora roreri]
MSSTSMMTTIPHLFTFEPGFLCASYCNWRLAEHLSHYSRAHGHPIGLGLILE